MSISQVAVYCCVSFPIIFLQFLFLVYTFGSLVKRAMHQAPLHALSVECIYIFFLFRCFKYINYINLLWREICSGVICQLFNKQKVAMSGNKTKFFKLYFLYLIDPRFPDNGKIEFVFGPNQDAVVPGLFIILAYLFNLNKIQVSFDVLKFHIYIFLM